MYTKNPKIDKLRSERIKNTKKIETLEFRNKEIARQLTELENLDIVGFVRDKGLDIDEFIDLIQSLKENVVPEVSENSENNTEREDNYYENE